MLRVIVIQGPPAAGKSTLVRRLANDLSIGYIAKDDLKELLYETLGTPSNREESKAYGQASIIGLYTTIEALSRFDRTILFESAFHPYKANKDFAKLRSEHDVQFFQVYCSASPEILLRRYDARLRAGERHPSHPDKVDTHTLDDAKQWAKDYGILSIENTIVLETNEDDEGKYATLLHELSKIIGDNHETTD